jgi:hypothetical protein
VGQRADENSNARHFIAIQIAGMRQNAGSDVVAANNGRLPDFDPATSVIASSGPTGKIPTFSPKSEARGRALEVLF